MNAMQQNGSGNGNGHNGHANVQDNLVVQAKELTKIYRMGEMEVQALRGASLDIERGETVAIMGPSGSGKSTLMNILGCLDRPSAGDYYLDGENVAQMGDDQLAAGAQSQGGFYLPELQPAAARFGAFECRAAACATAPRAARSGVVKRARHWS